MSQQSTPWKGCFVIPTYNNPLTIRKVTLGARQFGLPVIVVDDGSSAPGRHACAELQREGLAKVIHRSVNGGKGAAVKTGFRAAHDQGFTHVVQVDGDGQHDLSHVPDFVRSSRANPHALHLGYPVYDASVPRIRLIARRFTSLWVNIEVGRGKIVDAMIGFRVYPLSPISTLHIPSNRMDFDIEVAVRLAWAEVPVVNLPVRLRYLEAAEGGVSHFQVFWDNFRFSWLHSKLCTQRCMSLLLPKPRQLRT